VRPSPSYDGRVFVSTANTPNGDVNGATRFRYAQRGHVVSATYEGGGVTFGQLVALVDDEGVLDMRYQHVGSDGALRTGVCRSVPEELPDGRLRLHETWRWTSGDGSSGESTIEEVR
jgi:hypothetical protein